MRFFRRSFWYISIYFKRYRYLILASISISIFSIFLGRSLLSYLPQNKQKIYLGIVGSYTSTNLPEIVDDLLSAGLTQTGPDQTPIPNLSSNWDITDEGKKYLFRLKPGLVWSDGSPVKSKDIKLNIPKVVIEFPDDQTISFSLPETFAPFPAILNRALFNAKGQTPTGFLATVTQNNSGNIKDIRLEKNDRIYFIKIMNSISQAITAFKLGQIDHLLNLNTDPRITSNPSITVTEEVDYHHLVTIFMNTKDPLFTDKSIRQALAYSIPNKNQDFTKALSPIPPMSWAYNPLVKTYEYNQSRGTQLLKDNLPPNQKLNLEMTVLPEHLKTAEILKTELAKANVDINLRVVTAVPDNFQLFLGTLTLPNDPDQYSLWHSTQGTNITKIDDKKIDKLLEDGRTTIDQKERRLLYFDFQKTLLEELPAIFLYFPNRYQVSRGNFSL